MAQSDPRITFLSQPSWVSIYQPSVFFQRPPSFNSFDTYFLNNLLRSQHFPFSPLWRIAKSHLTNEEAETQQSQVIYWHYEARIAESVLKHKFHWIVLRCLSSGHQRFIFLEQFSIKRVSSIWRAQACLLHVHAPKGCPVDSTQEGEMLAAAPAQASISPFVLVLQYICARTVMSHSRSFFPTPLSYSWKGHL